MTPHATRLRTAAIIVTALVLTSCLIGFSGLWHELLSPNDPEGNAAETLSILITIMAGGLAMGLWFAYYSTQRNQ